MSDTEFAQYCKNTGHDEKLSWYSNREQLFFSTSGRAEVQTVSILIAPDGGNYQLEFNGYVTDPLAFNTSAANIAVAVNALPSMIDAGLTVTVNQAFSAGTSVTFTFSPNGPVSGNQVYLILFIMLTTAYFCRKIRRICRKNQIPFRDH